MSRRRYPYDYFLEPCAERPPSREDLKIRAWLGHVTCPACSEDRRQTMVGLPYAHDTCSPECERDWLDVLARSRKAQEAPDAD